MGVPAFFRWLSTKYPSIVVPVMEESTEDVNLDEPNPNGIEFDNLYLDMNGIIHPCTHPENKPAPETEDQMMIAIFEYIDRLMAVCRPRRLLYMAIDGVAPRAKMNQQRARRFRAAKDAEIKRLAVLDAREKLKAANVQLPEEKEEFDSNCITPGTEFMWRLAIALRYYIHNNLNNNPGWRKLKVILSDANCPGEGEHKIMDYIRRQRADPSHDPNTHHLICGADADLMMLALATHEPHFTIIREEFRPQSRLAVCAICKKPGHEFNECDGTMTAEDVPMVFHETPFLFIRISVLREYLEREIVHLASHDFERFIDDWVFICFFVGNDFLPHLPCLETREKAVDRLLQIYMRMQKSSGGNYFLHII